MATNDIAAQQINAATRRMVPQIYRAVMAQPTPALRAQVMRMILVGIDGALSERVATSVQSYEAQGLAPKEAVLQALADGLSAHMSELLGQLDALEGLGSLGTNGTRTTTTTTTRTPASIAGRQARVQNAATMIESITGAVNTLTQTAGNIAVSAQQARRGQSVTGLPNLPLPAGALPAAGLPAGPMDLSPYGQSVPGPVTGTPAWVWVVGGLVVVGGLGAVWHFTKKKPAVAAAA